MITPPAYKSETTKAVIMGGEMLGQFSPRYKFMMIHDLRRAR